MLGTGLVAMAEMSTEKTCIMGMCVFLYAWLCPETEPNLLLTSEFTHLTALSTTFISRLFQKVTVFSFSCQDFTAVKV